MNLTNAEHVRFDFLILIPNSLKCSDIYQLYYKSSSWSIGNLKKYPLFRDLYWFFSLFSRLFRHFHKIILFFAELLCALDAGYHAIVFCFHLPDCRFCKRKNFRWFGMFPFFVEKFILSFSIFHIHEKRQKALASRLRSAKRKAENTQCMKTISIITMISSRQT